MPKVANLMRDPGTAWVLLAITAQPWGTTGPTTGLVSNLKLLGTVAGIAIAFRCRKSDVPAWTAGWLFIAYAAVAGLGAITAVGQLSIADSAPLSDSLYRSVRLAVTVLAVYWLVSAWTLHKLLRTTALLATWVAGFAVGGHLLGLSPLFDGRMVSFVPPMSPNGLASIVGIGLVITLTLWLREELASRATAVSTILLVSALLLSQSRTSLIASSAAIVVALPLASFWRAIKTAYFAVLALLIAALAEVNPLAGSRFESGDTTFTGRTVGWDAIARLDRVGSRQWFGDGLAAKSVRDLNVFGGRRTIDGTWHSAFLEGGVLGLILLIAVVVLVLAAVARTALGRAALPPLLFLLIVATLESTLNDIAFSLVLLLGVGAAARLVPEPATADTAMATA